RRARPETFYIGLKPLELLITKLRQTAGLKIQDVHQSNEMDSAFVKAVPTGALGFDALYIPLTVKLSAIVKDIVLARYIKDIFCSAALEQLIKRVELLRFR